MLQYNFKCFVVVIMCICEFKIIVLIFVLGKMVVIGVKLEDDFKFVFCKYVCIIQKFGFNVKFIDFKIQNIVGFCDIKFFICLEGFVFKYYNFSFYEFELFFGFIYCMIKFKIVFFIFVSGKIVFIGVKVCEEIY